jgi:hypothetical protein
MSLTMRAQAAEIYDASWEGINRLRLRLPYSCTV